METKQEDDEDEEVDASNLPSKWKIEFTKKEWKKVVKLNKETGRYETTKDYGDFLQEKFSESNPVCVLKLNKRRITNPDDKGFGTKNFFQAYCLCIGTSCNAHYVFTLDEIPTSDKIEVTVR